MTTNNLSRPTSYGDMLKLNIEHDRGIWGDTLVRKGDFCIISGQAKVKKTFFAMALSACMIKGEPFLNIPMNKKAKVIYIQSELAQAEFFDRMAQIGNTVELHYRDANERLKDNTDGQLLLWDTKDLFLDEGQSRDRLEQEIKIHNPDIMVFDPVYLFTRAMDENDARAVKLMFQNFKILADRHNVGFIFVHHNRKLGEGGIQNHNSMRGSSVFSGIYDTHIQLENRVKATKVKFGLRNAANYEDVFCKLDNLMFKACTKDGKFIPWDYNVMILNLVGPSSAASIFVEDRVAETFKLNTRTVRNYIDDMCKDGLLVREPHWKDRRRMMLRRIV